MSYSRSMLWRLALLTLFLMLSACSTATVAPSATPTFTALPPSPTASATLPPPTETPLPTDTPTPLPTDTPTAEPSPTPLPTDTPTATATATAAAETIPGNAIVLYFVATDTGGPYACGDSMVYTYSGLVQTGDLKKDVATALNRLFSIGTQNVGNLRNSLYQSKLKVERIVYKKYDQTLTVYLTGNFVKPKTDCDQLRYREQVWATIRQFSGIKRIIVWLDDGNLLGDKLSARDR